MNNIQLNGFNIDFIALSNGTIIRYPSEDEINLTVTSTKENIQINETELTANNGMVYYSGKITTLSTNETNSGYTSYFKPQINDFIITNENNRIATIAAFKGENEAIIKFSRNVYRTIHLSEVTFYRRERYLINRLFRNLFKY
jgi:hypothetical protein